MPQILAIAELQPAYLPNYRAFFVYVVVALVLLLSLPRRLTLAEAITAVLFAALGFRYVRLTPLVFLATAPMLASRLTVWTTRGLDGRAIMATALAAGRTRVARAADDDGRGRAGGRRPSRCDFFGRCGGVCSDARAERPRLQQP